jgi:hypothetical protein
MRSDRSERSWAASFAISGWPGIVAANLDTLKHLLETRSPM